MDIYEQIIAIGRGRRRMKREWMEQEIKDIIHYFIFYDRSMFLVNKLVLIVILIMATFNMIQDISKPGRLRGLLRSTTSRWPSLRATAVLGAPSTDSVRDVAQRCNERNFSLVPRALQVEEDLIRIVDDYRSLVYAGSLL